MNSNFCILCGVEFSYRGTKCRTCVSRTRRYEFKKKAVEHLGGKCTRCGYSSHLAALEFHHIADDKDFTIGKRLNSSWEKIVKELDKCILLCSNCHRIEHSKYEEFMGK
jgi:5-methylcytosine-specific restriction endonuclease McrA